jgi:hypothetical protein
MYSKIVPHNYPALHAVNQASLALCFQEREMTREWREAIPLKTHALIWAAFVGLGSSPSRLKSDRQ